MRHCLLFCLLGWAIHLHGQTIQSVSNGNWTNPATWDCNCLPASGNEIIINHPVTLDTDYSYSAGSIHLNSGGKLIEDTPARGILMTGSGQLTGNGGELKINSLYAQSGHAQAVLFGGSAADTISIRLVSNYSTFTLSDVSMVSDSFYNDGYFNNNNAYCTMGALYNDSTIYNDGDWVRLDSFYNNGLLDNYQQITVSTFYNNQILHNFAGGIIHGIDSMTNAGTLTNSPSATIQADSFTNTSIVDNQGLMSLQHCSNFGLFTNRDLLTFYNFTNFGDFENRDSLVGQNNFWNILNFYNFDSTYFEIGGDFTNLHLMPYSLTATFDNDGKVRVLDSWYNMSGEVVSGVGDFVVQNTSYNAGTMIDSFDFCDLTPPLVAPFIDINSGSIANSISFCAASGTTLIAENTTIHVFPNPCRDYIFVELPDHTPNAQIIIYNAQGGLMAALPAGGVRTQVDVSGWTTGIYWVVVQGEQFMSAAQKIIVWR